MRDRSRQRLATRDSGEASYDEASRARYERRAARIGGGGQGGTDGGFKWLFIIMGVLFAIASGRLVWLHLIEGPELAEAARTRRTNVIELSPKRGTIYDRNGNVLAISVDCSTIYCNPKDVHDPSLLAEVLVKHLGGKTRELVDTLTSDTTFVYIQQRVDKTVCDALSQELREKELTGIYFLNDSKRVYPYGDTAGQVLGVLDTDGNALSGIELTYDEILKGKSGSMIMETGIGGTPIAGGAAEIAEPTNGSDIVISIDIEMQRAAERIISEGIKTYEAESGSVMVMDPSTGEIYAACSAPLPTITDRTTLDASTLNLKLISDSFEPGSVFKSISCAIGIEAGVITPDTYYYVPVLGEVGDHVIGDDDDRSEPMYMNVREILRRSSNVGMSKIAQESIGAEIFASGVEKFGIGQLTGIDYPGESKGIVKSLSEYDGSTLGTMSYGQGVAVPFIQIIRAFAALAHDGVATTPHFLVSVAGEEKLIEKGEQIVSPETARSVRDMMRTVVVEGTAAQAYHEGYDIAGKTGTSNQIFDSDTGYSEEYLVSSFCGFTPTDNAELLFYVGLNKTIYHSDVAVALFNPLMDEAINIFDLAPTTSEDNL